MRVAHCNFSNVIMRLVHCNFSDVKERKHSPDILSYDEIKEHEGIYCSVEDFHDGCGDRLIVLYEETDEDEDDDITVLWYCPSINLLTPADDSWRDTEYIRMDDEQFCVGIRKV